MMKMAQLVVYEVPRLSVGYEISRHVYFNTKHDLYSLYKDKLDRLNRSSLEKVLPSKGGLRRCDVTHGRSTQVSSIARL